MPQYVFACDNPACANKETGAIHQFEVTQTMDVKHEANCPKCGREARRVLFPIGVAFKGSGFHVNDYPSQQ